MKLLTLVHTCYKYEQTRAKIIDESWAKGLEDFLFICDSDDFSLSRSVNLGPYPSGPTYHPQTVMKIFEMFLGEGYQEYDWLFLVDDDTYCFPEKLKNFLEFFDSTEPLMMGDYLNWPRFIKGHKADYSSWVGGGPGVVFSRSAVIALVKYARRRMELINHDVWLHRLITREGSFEIKRVHLPGFHQYGAEELLEKFEAKSKNLISVHLNGDLGLVSRFTVES
jgi:hypothetical protein